MASGPWDLILVSIAAVIVLVRTIQGWRRGIVRQLVSIVAVIAASVAGIWGGGLLAPVVKQLGLPQFASVAVGSTLLGLVVYFAIRIAGTVLFKKTSQQSVSAVRWGYGIGGAILGAAYGCFTVFILFIAIRLLGTVAEADVQTARTQPRVIGVERPEPGPILTSLAAIKHTLDTSIVGPMMKQVDPMPAQVYRVLSKVTRVLADPRASTRFFDYPGANELSQNPKILALRNDPEIARLAQSHNLIALLRDPKIMAAADDPSLRGQLSSFQLENALDYALQR